MEKAYGIVPLYKDGSDYKVLLIQHREGRWGYPKGRPDPGEQGGVAVALRELAEETGITTCEVDEKHVYTEEYLKLGTVPKIVTYYLGRMHEKAAVVMQEEEVQDYARVTFTEAEKLLDSNGRRDVLKKVKELVTNSNNV